MAWGYRVWRAMHDAILKPSSEAQTVSKLKVALEQIWDNIPQVQLIKLSRVLQIVWQENVNGDRRQKTF